MTHVRLGQFHEKPVPRYHCFDMRPKAFSCNTDPAKLVTDLKSNPRFLLARFWIKLVN